MSYSSPHLLTSMRRYTFTLLFIICALSLMGQNASYTAYVKQYKDIAVRQMNKEGIPASIIMAQALLESGAGTSYLAREANNHFGIKCNSQWTGPSVKKDDDHKNECFRKYDQVEDSFSDHSAFLKRERYASLYKLPITDYKSWAHGLRAAGYATDPAYGDKLIRIIETYHLYELDNVDTSTSPEIEPETPDVVPAALAVSSGQVLFHKNKNLPYVQVGEGETIEDIATRHRKSVGDILLYNDMSYDDTISVGDILFLSPKRAKGVDKYYVIESGDTMYSISQRLGMTLESLYTKNRLRVGAIPPVGTRLYLQRNMPRREAKASYHIQ